MTKAFECPECGAKLGIEDIGAEGIVDVSVSDWSTREIVEVREYYCDHCGATLPYDKTNRYITEMESA